MKTHKRFSDIPKLIQSGTWECTFPLGSVLKQLHEWRLSYGLDLDPDFQRIHVWTTDQQIAWLEYLLSDGRTGRTIYFNCGGWNARNRCSERDARMVLVDGKQRLEALRRFYANEIPVHGTYLREYEDSPDLLRGGSLLFNVNDLPTRRDVVRWYIQMNAGGTPHTAEEIDRARVILYDLEREAEAR